MTSTEGVSRTDPADLPCVLQRLIDEIRDEQRRYLPESTAWIRNLSLRLCEEYPRLPPLSLAPVPSNKGREAIACARQKILLTLSSSIPEASMIQKAVDHWNHSAQSDASVEQFRRAVTPMHHSVFQTLYQQNSQLATNFVLALRADVARWTAAAASLASSKLQHSDDTAVRLLRRMDLFLREQVLSQWFAPGLLQIRRITYEQTPAVLIEQMARHEAVHPVQSLQDLRERVGEGRRVFALTHPLLPDQLLVVLHVALLPEIPSTMAQVRRHDVTHVNAACFYSISNLQPGLNGVGLGEYLIHQAVDQIQRDAALQSPRLTTFCTLSPIPRFRKWLEQKAAQTGTTWEHDILSEDQRDRLAHRLECPSGEALATLVEQLAASNELLHDDTVRDSLMSLAAHYLVREKHRRRPLDAVARFHLSNGALLYRINFWADTSRKGMANSYGIMVNYHYDLDVLSDRRARFDKSRILSVSDSVKAL